MIETPLLTTSLRLAVPSDLEALVALEARLMHFPMGHRVREWFRDDSPGDHRERFAVAEAGGEIVAGAALLSAPATYRGVPISTGVWEAVVTDEAYRRQGLCRSLFAFLEARFPADALFVQGLTWLYRRFAYFPALRSHGGWDSAGRLVRPEDLPESSLESRPAAPEDAGFLMRLQHEEAAGYVVANPASDAEWRYALRPDRTVAGPGETGLNRWREWRILVREGRDVGAFAHDPWSLAMLTHLHLAPGFSAPGLSGPGLATTWREAGAAAVRGTAAFSGATSVRTTLPDGHPLYAAFPRSFERRFRGYGDWAARIPDAPAFLAKIAPAMEGCLARSARAGWSGELTLSRVADGVALRFDGGRIAGIEPWRGERADSARVRLAPGRFEALVFGYRSIAAILAEDADCVADEEAEAALGALFPPGDSLFR